MAESLLNKAWTQLFNKYDILNKVKENGNYIITANQIREYREPRLMTKFDYSETLPEVFSKNRLSIIPISRSDFMISNHIMFNELKEVNNEITKIEFPAYIKSIVPDKITSEAIALNCAYLTGMLGDFLEDSRIVPTVSGRMASSKFEFRILNSTTKEYNVVNVDNSQIEIDGAYEGLNYLSLIEAKRNINKDFLVRQLYYPYRLWSSKVDKKVKVVYFVYSNEIFSFFEYQFTDINNYNSLKLIKHKNYSLGEIKITLKDITSIQENVQIIDEPSIPFPQADSFKRVINLCELIGDNELSADDITNEYEFDERQTSYYTSALMYLGLLTKSSKNKTVIYQLSALGKQIMNMKYIDRQLSMVKQILVHKVFNEAFDLYLSNKEKVDKNDIINLMKSCNLYHVESDETYKRRSQTVISWIRWIYSIIQ